jgi:hypothetical protein
MTQLTERIKQLVHARLKEESATGTGASITTGGGMGVATKYAYKKASKETDNIYRKLGFKPVNKKQLRKKSKFIEPKDLWTHKLTENFNLDDYIFDFEEFKNIPEPKYPYGFLLHWIIDDMIGSNIFKHGKSAFTNLVTRNRHVIPGNIIIATQAIMQIPKTIRLNSNLIVLFKFANKKNVIEDIHPVVSAYVTEDQLMELYEYATTEAHNALVIDGTGSKIIFKKNFDKILELNT